ncbi:hypothetical protein C8A03DRAFT_19394, partial [Achaetomium macrosporum]
SCKNDVRLCVLSYTYDADFDTEIKNWNDACQPYLTSTPTTPAGVTLSTTYNEQSCQTLYVRCEQLAITYSSCSSAYTAAADLSDCRCQTDVLSLASECEIDGAIECQRTTPDPSTLWGARYCSMTPIIPSDSPVTTPMPLPTDVSLRRPTLENSANSLMARLIQ